MNLRFSASPISILGTDNLGVASGPVFLIVGATRTHCVMSGFTNVSFVKMDGKSILAKSKNKELKFLQSKHALHAITGWLLGKYFSQTVRSTCCCMYWAPPKVGREHGHQHGPETENRSRGVLVFASEILAKNSVPTIDCQVTPAS